jgi:hypothetical protein
MCVRLRGNDERVPVSNLNAVMLVRVVSADAGDSWRCAGYATKQLSDFWLLHCYSVNIITKFS